MALTNYSDLLNSINGSGAWLHRTDLTTIMPDWVTLAEVLINFGDLEVLGVEGLRTGAQETVATLSTASGVQFVNLPSDFLEMRKVYYTYNGIKIELPQRPIIPMGQDEASNIQSIPRSYSIVGTQMYIYPTPNGIYPITLDYYAKIGPLATQGTNWLMTKAPNVYLAGSILAGAPWLGQNFDPTPWAQMFKAGMGQLTRADVKSRNRLTTMRVDRAYMAQAPFNILSGDYL